MDKLEKYISNNREHLDRYIPDSEIWNRIQSNKSVKRLGIRRIIAIAASLTILFGSTLAFMAYRNSINTSSSPALVESEYYYNSKVESLINEAEPLFTANPGLAKDLMNEMSDLDRIYADLKKDLKDNVSNEDVIEALILNYRVRIEILEEMIQILKDEKEKNEKNSNHEI